VHHVGILYDQFMMHGQRNIKSKTLYLCTLHCYSQGEYRYTGCSGGSVPNF